MVEKPSSKVGLAGGDQRDLERALHAAIKKVTASIADLRFNTRRSAEMMVFVNEATKAPAVPRAWFEMFVKILSPFAPHMCGGVVKRLRTRRPRRSRTSRGRCTTRRSSRRT